MYIRLSPTDFFLNFNGVMLLPTSVAVSFAKTESKMNSEGRQSNKKKTAQCFAAKSVSLVAILQNLFFVFAHKNLNESKQNIEKKKCFNHVCFCFLVQMLCQTKQFFFISFQLIIGFTRFPIEEFDFFLFYLNLLTRLQTCYFFFFLKSEIIQSSINSLFFCCFS